MEIVAEAHVFSEKAGLRTSDVEELIRQQIGPAGLMCSQRLTTGVYMPPRGEKPWTDINFALAGGKQVLDTATGFGVKLAISSLVSRHLEEAKAYGDAQGRERARRLRDLRGLEKGFWSLFRDGIREEKGWFAVK
ncbi:6-phosphogluconate dehydrogenase family protein [Colletotrichum higginsianum]|nr:6-phosphogluconate dehydrogenase family protein [Colletotrichum higginsianum]